MSRKKEIKEYLLSPREYHELQWPTYRRSHKIKNMKLSLQDFLERKECEEDYELPSCDFEND